MLAQTALGGVTECLADKLFYTFSGFDGAAIADFLHNTHNVRNGNFCNGKTPDHWENVQLHAGQALGAIFFFQAFAFDG